MSRITSQLLRLMPAPVKGRLRAWRFRKKIGRVVEHTYGGGQLKVYLADPLSQAWYDLDWSELPEIATLRTTRLQPGAKVFDLGAHQGVVAMMLAREVGPHGLVVAVEPSPHNTAASVRNRDLNRMQQIEVLQAAVSDQPGTLVFNERANSNGQLDDGTGDGRRFTVESVTIDGLAEQYGLPDVVFIDVEGAESRALAGAARVLASGAEFFIEVHVGCGLENLGGSVAEILSHFPDEEFSLLVRSDEDTEFRPFTESDPVTRVRFFLIARPKELPKG